MTRIRCNHQLEADNSECVNSLKDHRYLKSLLSFVSDEQKLDATRRRPIMSRGTSSFEPRLQSSGNGVNMHVKATQARSEDLHCYYSFQYSQLGMLQRGSSKLHVLRNRTASTTCRTTAGHQREFVEDIVCRTATHSVTFRTFHNPNCSIPRASSAPDPLHMRLHLPRHPPLLLQQACPARLGRNFCSSSAPFSSFKFWMSIIALSIRSRDHAPA